MSDQDKEKLLQQLKDAIVAIRKLKGELKEERQRKAEPVAVIGMAMRFPGKVNNARDYWNLLKEGTDAITPIPSDRFDVDALYDPEPGMRGKINVREGGFVDGVDQFDGSFFDITPVELESTDPQQRFLLELTHEAMEDAGQNVQSLVGSNTGVYIGISCNDYTSKHFRSGDYDLVGPYAYTGAAVSASAGRISYMMGFQGPSITLDTACSATIVTAHLATAALRIKECDMAVVGGANLILGPEMHICFSNLNALSPDGRCKTFDDAANGYVRSEGSAVIVLKRLSDAQRDGDRVLAVIKGSAINQDGRSNGFTAPNVAAQVKVIEQALENAQLTVDDIRYIEAHGTGTKIGDPIEVEALTKVFSSARSKEDPLLVGSVKSNIGHLESTAGMASIIKAVLCLQHGMVPPSIHVKKPNELINWKHIPVSVATQMTPLPGDAPNIGVSGFGITGTNGHIILGKAPDPEQPAAPATGPEELYVLPVSAKSPAALQALAGDYAEFILNSNEPLTDICAFAALKRAHFAVRKTFIADTKEGLIEQLQEFKTHGGTTEAAFDEDDAPSIVFAFSGQGAQWAGMGQELFRRSEVFRSAIEECREAFKPYVDWDLLEELEKDDSSTRLGEGDVMQPLLFAIGVATARWWMSKGLSPDVVIGHSMGEIAAAYIGGHISLDEAALIVCTRSRLMEREAGKGVMGATDLTEEEANQRIRRFEGKLSVAVMNSPSVTVIGGDADAMDDLFAELEQDGRFCKRVRMNVASHTAQMEPVLAPLREALSGLQPKVGGVRFHSTTLNKTLAGSELTADYWLKNVRQPVRFGEAISSLSEEGPSIYIEVGPHAVLSAAMEENLMAKDASKTSLVASSFYRAKDEWRDIHTNLAAIYASGYGFDWKGVYPTAERHISLPTYAWQRERYWFDETPKKLERAQSKSAATGASGDFYTYSWEAYSGKPSPSENKKILIVSAGNGMSDALSSPLAAAQAEVEVTRTEQLALALDGGSFDKVLFLSTGSSSLEKQVARNLDLLDVVRQLSESGLEKIPQVSLVTLRAFESDEYLLNTEGAMLWGVMRTLANEHPEVRPVSYDTYDLGAPELVSLLLEDDAEHTAYRVEEEVVKVPVFEPMKNTGDELSEWTGEGVLLVTGGTSGLGLSAAGFLAANGAKRIALVSRSGAKEETAAAVKEMRNAGAVVEIYSADVSSATECSSLADEIEQSMGTITGVVHAAGVLDDGMALNLTADQFIKVAQPKITAARVVYDLLKTRGLKRFLAFSSAAHLLGNSGQANYNAANAAMDQLVFAMGHEDIRSVVVNWGNIGGIGMAAEDEVRGQRLASLGITPISPDQLPGFFKAVFSTSAGRIIPMRIDFDQWISHHPTQKADPVFQKVRTAAFAADTARPEARWGTQPSDVLRNLKAMIREHLGAITKIPLSRLREEDTFKSMGVDSMMALQVRNKIQESTGLTLAVSSIWAHPTIEKYASFLAGSLVLPVSDGVGESKQWTAKQLRDLLKASVSSVTKLPEGRIRETDTFKSMGVDSMQALQIRNLVQTAVGITLPVSTIWAHPTIEKYTAFLEESLRGPSKQGPVVETPAVSSAEIQEEVDDLSLDELMKQLDDKSKEH